MVDVSIVIVCMKNIHNLSVCLDSIKKYTSISYEVLVVAYLFDEKLKTELIRKYPWITLIESDEIRGFSANNNLALRRANGKYCFVLNDDTELRSPVIDDLVSDIISLDDTVAIVSPNIKFPDGAPQICGRPPFGMSQFVLNSLSLWDENKHGGKYVNQKGLFRSYNILGAAFLIKTEIFRKIDFFDEYYFFCPEDLDLSTRLNKNGYSCYVDADVELFHICGESNIVNVTQVKKATYPAANIGMVHFLAEGSSVKRFILVQFVRIVTLLRALRYKIKSSYSNDSYDIYAVANLNSFCTIGSDMTPYDVFCKYYKSL